MEGVNKKKDDPIALIPKYVVGDQFGDDIQREVYMSDERIGHIIDHHADDYKALGHHIPNAIAAPDIVLRSSKDERVAMFIKHIDGSGLNVLIRIAPTSAKDDRSFVLTMHAVGNQSIRKLKRKNPIIYESGKI